MCYIKTHIFKRLISKEALKNHTVVECYKEFQALLSTLELSIGFPYKVRNQCSAAFRNSFDNRKQLLFSTSYVSLTVHYSLKH